MPLGFSRYDDAALQRRLWTPRVLAGSGRLTRWWDAGDPSTLSIAASVLSIRDKIAGAATALGGAGNTTYAPTANGRRGLVISTSSIGTQTATAAGDHSLYFCTLPNTNASNTFIMASGGNNGSGLALLGFGWANASPSSLFLTSNATGLLTGSSTFATAAGPVVGSARTLSGGSQIYANGKLEGTDTTVGSNATGTGIATLMDDINADPYSGTAYEWLYWAGRHSDAEMRQVEGYLAWKWNLQNRLAGTHPYRNRPPTIGG